jgi:hypothetical protein
MAKLTARRSRALANSGRAVLSAKKLRSGTGFSKKRWWVGRGRLRGVSGASKRSDRSGSEQPAWFNDAPLAAAFERRPE